MIHYANIITVEAMQMWRSDLLCS